MAENLKKASPNARFGVEIFKVYKKTGFSGYFRGLNTGLALSLTRAGSFFPFYEYCKGFWRILEAGESQ